MSLPELNELSERERDILRLVATGAGNKQIAAQLFISTNTVKVHLRNIFAKIGVNSRTEAAMVAIRLGLVESSSSPEAEAAPSAGPAGETAPGIDSVSFNGARLDPPSASDGASAEKLSSAADGAPAVEAVAELAALRRLNRRQAWGLGLAALIVLIGLGIFGLIQMRARNENPRQNPAVTGSPAPSVTPLPRWLARSSLPAARMDLAVVAYDDQVYAIGGETADGVSGAVERYDPVANSWTALHAKPQPVADVQAVAIGGKIYVPGGRTATGAVTDTLEIYDPSTDRWQQGAHLPAAVSAYAITAFEGRLYLFGGWDGSQYTSLDSIYDPRLNAWSAISPMPTRRAFAGAAVASGRIYVIGGKNDQGALPVVEVYSPDREGRDDPWRVATPMPEGRFGMAISSVADIIYVVCGQNSSDAGASPAGNTPVGNSPAPLPSLAHIPQTDVWQTFESPPADQSAGAGLAISGEYLYIVGGKLGTAPLADLQAYQIVYTVGIPVIIK